jgi:hypothetical protein
MWQFVCGMWCEVCGVRCVVCRAKLLLSFLLVLEIVGTSRSRAGSELVSGAATPH